MKTILAVLITAAILTMLGCATEPHGCSIGYEVGPDDGCYQQHSK